MSTSQQLIDSGKYEELVKWFKSQVEKVNQKADERSKQLDIREKALNDKELKIWAMYDDILTRERILSEKNNNNERRYDRKPHYNRNSNRGSSYQHPSSNKYHDYNYSNVNNSTNYPPQSVPNLNYDITYTRPSSPSYAPTSPSYRNNNYAPPSSRDFPSDE